MAYTLSGPALRVLLTFWTDPAIGREATPPHEEVGRTLIPLGLMEYTDDGYRVTQKGDAYLRHLLQQPMPVEIPLVTWGYPDPTN